MYCVEARFNGEPFRRWNFDKLNEAKTRAQEWVDAVSSKYPVTVSAQIYETKDGSVKKLSLIRSH